MLLLTLFAALSILVECDSQDSCQNCGDDQVCCLKCSADYLNWASLDQLYRHENNKTPSKNDSCNETCVNGTSCLGYDCEYHSDCSSDEDCCNRTCNRQHSCIGRSSSDDFYCDDETCCFGGKYTSRETCSSLVILMMLAVGVGGTVFLAFFCFCCFECCFGCDTIKTKYERRHLIRQNREFETTGQMNLTAPRDEEEHIETAIQRALNHITDIEEQQREGTTQSNPNHLDQTSPLSHEQRCSTQQPILYVQLPASQPDEPPPPYNEVGEERSGGESDSNHLTVMEEHIQAERSAQSNPSQPPPLYVHLPRAEPDEPPPPYNNEGAEERPGVRYPESDSNHVIAMEERAEEQRTAQRPPSYEQISPTEPDEPPPPYYEV